MKKILVPTDFSVNANNALVYALHLKKDEDVRIILLHVIEIDLAIVDMPIPSGSAYEAKKEAAEATLAAQVSLACEQTKRKDDSNKIRTLIKAGNPVTLIKDTATDEGVDIIIMGARGKKVSGLDKFLGTRSSDIAQESDHPVMIIPEDVYFKPIVQLAYASELLPSDPYEVWKALKLIAPFSPIVRYVHVTTNPSDMEDMETQQMKEFVESQPESLQILFHNVQGKNIEEEIEDFCQTYDVDLLVMFHKKQNIFYRMLVTSHTKKILTKIQLPILVMKK